MLLKLVGKLVHRRCRVDSNEVYSNQMKLWRLVILALIFCALSTQPSLATVTTSNSKVVDSGNGSTTSFSYNFLIPGSSTTDQTNVQVIYTDSSGNATTLTPSQYSVSGINSASGGFVQYPLVGSPIASGTTLTILRNMAYTQSYNFSNQGNFYPANIMGMGDYITMLVQQLLSITNNFLYFPPQDTTSGKLPSIANRANKFLGFDSNGAVSVSSAVAAGVATITATSPLSASASTGNITLSMGSANPVATGGTGLTAVTGGSLLYGNGTSAMNTLGIGATSSCLVSNGSAPTWGSCSGSSNITIGTSATATNPQKSGDATTGFFSDQTGIAYPLSVTNNYVMASTGSAVVNESVSSLLDGFFGTTQGNVIERGSSAWQAIAAGTSGYVLTSNGAGADPSYQAPATNNSGSVLLATVNASSSSKGIWLDNFEPYATAVVSVGTGTNTTIVFTDVQSIQASDVMFGNKGTTDVYVGFGTTTASSTAVVPGIGPVYNGMPVEAGAVKVVKKGVGNNFIGLISTGSTNTINVTCGVGS
ncbi:unnamed protein product [Sphagnum compactum]